MIDDIPERRARVATGIIEITRVFCRHFRVVVPPSDTQAVFRIYRHATELNGGSMTTGDFLRLQDPEDGVAIWLNSHICAGVIGLLCIGWLERILDPYTVIEAGVWPHKWTWEGIEGDYNEEYKLQCALTHLTDKSISAAEWKQKYLAEDWDWRKEVQWRSGQCKRVERCHFAEFLRDERNWPISDDCKKELTDLGFFDDHQSTLKRLKLSLEERMLSRPYFKGRYAR